MSVLPAAVSQNLGLKATSVLLAVALYSYVRGAGNVQRAIEVPVTVVLPVRSPGRPVLLSEVPDKVRLTVQGSPSLVNNLRAETLGPIQLDLREGRRRQVRFDARLVRLPAGVTYYGFTPELLDLHWDVLVSRSLPIRPDVVGTPLGRSRLGPVLEVEPQTVRVTGPALLVDPIVSVHTEPVDITGLGVGRHERRIPLEPPRSGVDFDLTAGARVSLEVVPVFAERRFSGIELTALGPQRVSLRPPAVELSLRGDPAVLERLRASAVVPFVDTSTMTLARGPGTARVQLRPLPEGVDLVSVSPADVIVVPQR